MRRRGAAFVQDPQPLDCRFRREEWRGGFEPLAGRGFFARVFVDPESATITWPNGVDMVPEPLYDEARRNAASAPAGR